MRTASFRGFFTSGRHSRGCRSDLLKFPNDVNLNVVCVYAPTQPAQRSLFLRSLHKFFFTHASLIVCGDFNCYDNVRDKFAVTPPYPLIFRMLNRILG